MKTGRFPLFVFVNMCIVKFWLKILKSCDTTLISAAYDKMMQNLEKYAGITHIKDLLCSRGFGKIWRDQSVVNRKLLVILIAVIHAKRTEKLKLFTSVKIILIAILDMI